MRTDRLKRGGAGGGGSKNFFIMFRINYMDLSKYQKVELKARNNPLQAFKTDLY